MKIPSRLIEFLNQNHIAYKILHHPVAYTAQELAAIEGIKGHEHAKVVMVKVGPQLVMTVLPSDHRIMLDKLGELTGQAVTLATEAEFKATFPDCETGTMPPFGNLYGVETYVERDFTQNTRIAFEAGTHSDAITMSYQDYERLACPKIAGFGAKSH